MILRPYQRTFARAVRSGRHRRCLWLGPRQVGKDFVLGYLAGQLALATGHDIMCLNKDQRQSTKFLRVIDAQLKRAAAAGLPIRDPTAGNTVETRIRRGDQTVSIYSLPGTPDAMQGYTGHGFLNEIGASRHDPDAIMAQADSVISSDPRLRIVAATNATRRGTWLHRFIEGDDERSVARRRQWHIYRTTIHDVYPDGLPAHVAELQDTMTRSAWARWFLCEFTDAGDGTFDLTAPDPVLHGQRGVRLMAVDVGATRHPSAYVVVEHIGDGWAVVDERVWWGEPLWQQPETIAAAFAGNGCQHLYIDRGGVGMSVHQALEARLGAPLVTGVSVTDRSRATAAEILLSMQRRVAFGGGVTRDHLSEILGDPSDAITVPEIHPHGEPLHHCDAADALLMLVPHMAGRRHAPRTHVPELRRRRQYAGM